jgi:tetratricopeptide (TPR) repeat protein
MEIGVPCHLNLAATFFNLKQFRDSIQECEKTLYLDQANSKATLRWGMVAREMNDFETAEKQFEKVEKIMKENRTPNDEEQQSKILNELKKERALLQRRILASKQEEKQVYKNMFEKLKNGPALYENQTTTNENPNPYAEWLGLGLAIALNFIASTSIVFANKLVLKSWPNPIALTGCHFFVSFLGSLFCWLVLDLFKPKRFVLTSALLLAASFAGFIVLANLSLHSNSVGVYQLMKSMTA